jgi:hypothetical protein
MGFVDKILESTQFKSSLDNLENYQSDAQRWLHSKLAEWIGENLQEALGFPDNDNARASAGSGWTAAELNHILQVHAYQYIRVCTSMY